MSEEERIYYGPEEKLPKGYTRFASMIDILNSTQVKRYGRYKIDNRLLSSILKPKDSKKFKKQKIDEQKLAIYKRTLNLLTEKYNKGEIFNGPQIKRYNTAYDNLTKLLGRKPKVERLDFTNKKIENKNVMKKVSKKIDLIIDDEVQKILKTLHKTEKEIEDVDDFYIDRVVQKIYNKKFKK
jgi:hypothetical protein